MSPLFPKDRVVRASDGTRLAYTVVAPDAAGVPVVFVNGWTCSDGYWATIGPRVADAGHPCVYLDLRGHGESGLPRAPGIAARNLRPEDVSIERLALDVAEVVRDAGLAPAVLAGHSMGVQAIVEACRVAPDVVAGLVPIAGTFENPVRTFADLAVLDRLYPVADVLFRFLPFEVLRPVMRRAATPATGHRAVRMIRVAGPKVTQDHVAGHMAHIGDVNFSVLFKMMGQLRRHEAADLLPTLRVPVLVLAGRRDLFTPPSVQERMADLVPDAEIVWFDEGGHLLPVEEGEGVAEAICSFLQRRFG